MSAAPASAPSSAALPSGEPATVRRVFETLGDLVDDASVPRNVRRGAQSVRAELGKPNVPLDVRIASAVYLLDDLANDPNLPTHGRTALWSIISSLESVA